MSDITHFFVIHFASRTLAKHPDRIIHAIEPQKTHLTLIFCSLPCLYFLVKWITFHLLHKPRGPLVFHL